MRGKRQWIFENLISRVKLGRFRTCINSLYIQQLHSLYHTAMRPVKACAQCRCGKRRCDRIGTESACEQCIQRNLPCSVQTVHFEAQAPSPASSSLYFLPMVTRHDEEVFELVDLYFKFMHDKPHTLFHEPSFKSSVVSGTASRLVLLSMMGLSAR